MQRKSHVLNEIKPEDERIVEHRRPLWVFGFLIFITSNILGSLFQIASLPVVILAPLGAVSLLWNAFFARILLGDLFSPYMVLGTLAIAGGAVLIALFGIVPVPTHSLEDLLKLFRREAFIVYFSLLGAAVGICLAVTHIIEFSLRHRLVTPIETPPETPPFSPIPSSPPFSLNLNDCNNTSVVITESTPLLSDNGHGKGAALALMARRRPTLAIRRMKLFLAVSYASISGIMSGMCLLFAKSGVELLILTAQGDNQFWRWEAWALAFGLIGFALFQSLILANPILVCPLAFCFYNLSSILNGLVYYDQFGSLSTLHLGLVILGLCILLAGVWAVSVTSGNGGVEPGTWQEGAEDVEEEVLVEEPSSYPEQHGRSMTEGAGSSSMSQSGSLASPVGRRKFFLRKQRYPSLLSVGGNEGSSGGVGGLSIGLSATSPGFALKPTKRRIPSGQRANALFHAANRMGMRRTVSEADVGMAGGSIRARARWKWLQNVFKSSEDHQGEE
ncbi:hypothetical protein Clacol_003909 [Clathrus columnatus]|uniref:Uncharacterized protein n=1 Tax=Clathrus columnatus TaxID=1419009 RepID=A0AAV5ACN5_9AGAM|nr:hypothetical protein Clacol_003909 [Clathrus columnatus]